MKRIIKEVREDGTEQYRVESKIVFLGITWSNWHTDTVYRETRYGGNVYDAVFSTLREALVFCGIEANPIVKREVLFENIK